MRKLFIILGLLFVSFIANSQGTVRYLGTPQELIKVRGSLVVDSVMAVPSDTLMRAGWDSTKKWIAAQGDSLYLWSPVNGRYVLAGGSGGGGGGANNYPTSLSFSNSTLTLGRNGLANLTATIPLQDTASALRSYMSLRYDSSYYKMTQYDDTTALFHARNRVDTLAISLANGDKGDIVVQDGWTSWIIDNGAVTNDKLAGSIAQTKVTGLTDSIAAKQQKILWQDEGSDLGGAGSIDTVDITGAGIEATRSNSKLTLNVTASGGGMDSIEIVEYDTLATKNLWINSTTNRMGYRIDSFIYHLEITDSVRYVYAGGSSYDADAQAYFDAIATAGGSLTDPQKEAYNDFVLELKAANIFSTHFDFIHLLMGGSEAAVKFNLVNPLNTDGAHRLTFPNSATFNSTGVLCNGTNQYINTHFNPSTAGKMLVNDAHIAAFSRTTAGTAGMTWGVTDGAGPIYAITRSTDNNTYFRFTNQGEGTFADGTTGRGWYMQVKQSSVPNYEVLKDNSSWGVGADNGAGNPLPNYDLYFNAYNNVGSPVNYAAKELSIICAGKFLNSTQRTALYTAVSNLVTALGL